MSNRILLQACAASALLMASPAALAQTNTADPALNTTTEPMAGTDPAATNTITTDPLATDTMGSGTSVDPLAADPALTMTEEEDDDDFPWGLLGLLGLAGLLGMKRRDRDDVHVDRANARTDRM